MTLDTLNWKDCIKQSNDKPDLAQQLLDMLALELPDFKQYISTSLQKNDIKQLHFHAHKLHGACCYCGANQLKSLLHELENNIESWSPTVLLQKTRHILDEIDAVAHIIKTKQYK